MAIILMVSTCAYSTGTTKTRNAPTISPGSISRYTFVWAIDERWWRKAWSTFAFWRRSWTPFRKRLFERDCSRHFSMFSRRRGSLARRKTRDYSTSSRHGQCIRFGRNGTNFKTYLVYISLSFLYLVLVG